MSVSLDQTLNSIWTVFDVVSHTCILWIMTLVYGNSCEVARPVLLQLPLQPCKSSDSIALILQNVFLYRIDQSNVTVFIRAY